MIVKALLVVPVAAFHLAVVARCSWTYELVLNAELPAEGVHGMDAVRLPCVSELRAVVGLDDCRNVFEEKDSPSDEIAGGGTALLHVGVDEAGMRRMGAVRTIHKAAGRTVVALVPAKERRFGNLVSSANERDVMFQTIKFYSVDAGVKFVWQITLDWCYNGHAIKSPFWCF